MDIIPYRYTLINTFLHFSTEINFYILNFYIVLYYFEKITLLFFSGGAFYIVIGRGAQANRSWSNGRIFAF